jgi:hypothetical protein
MAFNNLQPSSGPFYLGPGESTGLVVWFGDPGDDHGAQWIMAHPLKGEPPTALEVSGFQKILAYSIASVTQNGAPQYGYDADSAYYQYAVTVTNRGSQGVRFNVQGGGNS